MKKIIINGRFLLHRTTGVERYAREILLELDKIIKPGEIEMAIPPQTEAVPAYQNIKVKKTGRLKNRLWEHISFPLYVKKEKAISLNLCNAAPLLSPGIVCLHDMKIKVHPEYFSWKFRLWYGLLFQNTARRAKKIITVSEFSKKEIVNYYGLKAQDVIVIPDAWQHYVRIGFDEYALRKYGLKKAEYYFAMGSMEPNKNFKWVAAQAKANPDRIFAVAGAINEKVFAEGLGFDCPPNMKLLGFVSDEEAKTLMRDCCAFLFPTHYEGFGIPPLEAISAGARCIVVSDSKVMHEVFENAVNYVDPNQYTVKIEDFVKMSENMAEQILQKYSWESSAKKLYKVLREL